MGKCIFFRVHFLGGPLEMDCFSDVDSEATCQIVANSFGAVSHEFIPCASQCCVGYCRKDGFDQDFPYPFIQNGTVIHGYSECVAFEHTVNCKFLGCCCNGVCKNRPDFDLTTCQETSCPVYFNDQSCRERATICKPEDNFCPTGTGCCLCDRCCDMDSVTCVNKGGTVMSGSCTASATQTSCKNANVRPPCKQGTWKLAMRSTAHTAKPGKMSIASSAGQRTNDYATGTNECRTSYGWLQRHATKGAMEGRICNKYSNSCMSGANANKKRSPTLKLVRNATRGVMEWQGRYRTPCPESSDMGCSTTVGCL